MGELKDRIAKETTNALKAGDKVRVGTLRLLSAAIKNREVEVGHELDDDEVTEIAVREGKKRRESIEAYGDAGRQDLVDKEQAELDILKDYLPEQMPEAELDAIIDEAIAATGAASPQEMGKVMGQVMAKAKGKADGKVVQGKVKAKLGD